MSTVTITVGIPASGKSTYARKEARDDANTVIVCRDDIRATHGWKSGQNEERVTQIHRAQIEAALLDGFDVIVADTNINKRFRNKLIKFAHEHGADVEIVIFEVSLDEAITRDLNRKDSVGPDVVSKFYRDLQSQDIKDEFIPCPSYAIYDHHEHRDNAVVVDIDGTLAHMAGRSPYDESRVGEDKFDYTVAAAVQGMALEIDAHVIVLSGRTEDARVATQKWLAENGFLYRSLLMRKKGDQRPDYVIKNEIYDAEIIPKYNVAAVFDDRDQVVRHLRKRGITVFQVADGRF
jgi:predicted kinase